MKLSQLSCCFSSSSSSSEIKFLLRNDPQNRFHIIQQNENDSDEEIMIERIAITESEYLLREGVEEWKTLMLTYLSTFDEPIDLSRLAVDIQRPSIVPRSVRIKDVLKSDHSNRFHVYGPPCALLVVRFMSPSEIEGLKQIWRLDVYNFISQLKS